MLYKQWLGAKCTVTVNGGQNNANKTEWGNDISLMKRLGNICLTVISHLDTSTCTKLRYYIKLLVRSCSSWGNMTDLGLHGGWACVQMIKDRNVDTSLCAHVDTHTWCCLSVNLNSVKTSLLSHVHTTSNDNGGENERKSLERFRRLSKVKTSQHVQHFSNSALFLDRMPSCSAPHSTLLF